MEEDATITVLKVQDQGVKDMWVTHQHSPDCVQCSTRNMVPSRHFLFLLKSDTLISSREFPVSASVISANEKKN